MTIAETMADFKEGTKKGALRTVIATAAGTLLFQDPRAGGELGIVALSLQGAWDFASYTLQHIKNEVDGCSSPDSSNRLTKCISPTAGGSAALVTVFSLAYATSVYTAPDEPVQDNQQIERRVDDLGLPLSNG